MSENKARIEWVDGVRGILTIWIVVFHYYLAFVNKGYVGFETNYAKNEFMAAIFDNIPASIFLNSSNFPVGIFMLLVAFIPAHRFFGNQDEDSVVRQAKKRYTRFMIPTFLSFVVCFILYHAGLLMNVAAGEKLGVRWLSAIMDVDHSFSNLLYDGLILTYIKGSNYVSASWIIGYLFIGSYISYAILLLFGRMKNRVPAYAALLIFFFVYEQMYICFIMGIVAADIIKSRESRAAKETFYSSFLIIFGLALGLVPGIFLPKFLNVYTVSAIAACMLIVGISENEAVQHLLKNKALYAVSDCSFVAILFHVPVMAVISCRQYLIMSDMGIAKNFILLSVFIIAIPAQMLAIFLFQKLVSAAQRFVHNRIPEFG